MGRAWDPLPNQKAGTAKGPVAILAGEVAKLGWTWEGSPWSWERPGDAPLAVVDEQQLERRLLDTFAALGLPIASPPLTLDLGGRANKTEHTHTNSTPIVVTYPPSQIV